MADRPSPNFAAVAAGLLRDGNPAAAVALCADGLRHYPNYAGGYVVLANAYAAAGRADDAHTIATAGSERFPWLVMDTVDHVEVVGHVDDADVVDAVDAVDTVDDPDAVDAVDHMDTMDHTDTVDTADDAPIAPVFELPRDGGLRMIDTASMGVADTRVIRSSSVRLIPGLEFTSLRFEGMKSRGRRSIQTLVDPPPFRSFHAPMRPQRSPLADVPVRRERPRLSLEELAARLEKARMPRPDDRSATAPPSAPPPAPVVSTGMAVVTETIARIYEAQGALDKALDAYRQLQRQKPERAEHFQALIDAVLARMTP